MTRPRRSSAASEESTTTAREPQQQQQQELGSMYDYLAKVILLGPSGTGKSCLLHRFVKNEWRVLSSQTIGVEFASKVIKVGSGPRRKRIKLQLWDTAGTERFRAVSRSYYRGAAGAILVYDTTSHKSFSALPPFLNDARALASPNLTVLLAGNKVDLARQQDELDHDNNDDDDFGGGGGGESYGADSSFGMSYTPSQESGSYASSGTLRDGAYGHHATIAPDGRQVSAAEAARWASASHIPVVMEVSAFSGEGVDEIFGRLARMILTKIELGEIDPDDPMSGIQYGDAGAIWGGASDGASMRSGVTGDEGASGATRGKRKRARGWSGKSQDRGGGLRDWEEVFTLSGRSSRSQGCSC